MCLSVFMFVCLFHYNEGIYALTIKMKTLAMESSVSAHHTKNLEQ